MQIKSGQLQLERLDPADVPTPATGEITFINKLTGRWQAKDSTGTVRFVEADGGGSGTKLVARADSVAGVKPTALEWPTPSDKNQAVVLLDDGTQEMYEYQTNAWVLLQTIAPGAPALVNVQNGAHAFGTTGTGTSASFAVAFPQPFTHIPIVELTYQWNYNATTNGNALNPVLILDGTPSLTGFTYRIVGGRNLLDRVNWTAIDPLTTINAANEVLTPRKITGSIVADGWDGYELPYQIDLPLGKVLDTVTLNGVATTDFNPVAGTVKIKPNGGDVAVAHTVVDVETFTGFQSKGVWRAPNQTTGLEIENLTVTTNIDFRKCDFLYVTYGDWDSGNGYRKWDIMMLPVSEVADNVETWYSGRNGGHGRWKVVNRATGTVWWEDDNGSISLFRIEGIAQGENKIVVPKASSVLNPRKITGSITANAHDGVKRPYKIPLLPHEVLDTVTLNGVATTDFEAAFGLVNIDPNGGDVVVAHTTKVGATFNSLATVSDDTFSSVALSTSGVVFTLASKLQDGDLLMIFENYNNNTTENHPHWVRAEPGGNNIVYQYPATGNSLTVVFPNPLTNQITLKGATNQYVRRIQTRRDTINKAVIPFATTMFTERTITVNPGGHTFICRDDDWRFIKLPGLAVTDQIATLSGVGGADVELQSAVGGWFAVRPHGVNPTITVTTGPIGADFVRFMGNKTLNGSAVAVGALVNGDTDTVIVAIPTGGIWRFDVGCIGWDDDGSGNLGVRVDLLAMDGTVLDSDMVGISGNHLANNWVSLGVCTLRTNLPTAGNYQVRITEAGAAAESNGLAINSLTAERCSLIPALVPPGLVVGTTYHITVNGGAAGHFDGHEDCGSETFYMTMPIDEEVDVFPVIPGVVLRNRQFGMFSVTRAVGAGDLAIAGVTFRAMAPNAAYFGTWENQAGDASATNGGHTCARRLLRGSGITTTNDSLITLSGGIYRIRSGITSHFANAVWRQTSLVVDGSEVTFMRTGRDGGNWDGGSPLEWVVDATTVNHTVQIRRTSSSGNGNSNGWLAIERIVPVAAPDGVTLYLPRTITGTNVIAPGARDNTLTGFTIGGIAAGSEVLQANLVATGGATVLLHDTGRAGTAHGYIVPNGANSAISYTPTVWRRALTATLNGAAANISGAASVNVDATRSVAFWITLPANHSLTAAPVVTGGTLLAWDSAGSGVIQPDNTGNITVTANSAQAGARSARFTSNAGVWTPFGSIQIMMSGGGNRSAQVRSVSGNIDVVMHSWTGWDATSGVRSVNIGINSNDYVEPAYGFGNSGNNQFGWIHDTTNNRRYEFVMTVGGGYNNNTFWIKEVT